MKVTTPLALKVTCWLALNLVFLAVAAFGLVAVQGGIGWSALLAGRAGDRFETTATRIAADLAAAAPEDRNAVLAEFEDRFDARLHVLRLDDPGMLRGFRLPSILRPRIESLRPPSRPGFPREFGPGDPRRDARGRHGELESREPPPGDDAAPVRPVRRPEATGTARGELRFLERTSSPTAYWVGTRVFGAFERGPRAPTLVIVQLDSLWGLLRFLGLESWILGGAGVLALSILFWLPLVRSITQSLRQLTLATERIAEGRFDTRVAADRRDELGLLGASVNRMATQLDAHLTGQKRFLGDVAHELCSPLSRLQLASGILADQAPDSLQPTVADLREEVQQLSTLVNELLAFTKAGLRPRDVNLVSVELGPLIAQVVEREAPGRITLNVPEGLRARAEPDLLQRALGNLVRNALRYAGESGPIQVRAQPAGAQTVIAVEDSGPGVPAADLNRLGEPFFRPELARTRESGGVGLGLAIVRSSVAACGGEVRFSNRTPRGFRAEIRLASR